MQLRLPDLLQRDATELPGFAHYYSLKYTKNNSISQHATNLYQLRPIQGYNDPPYTSVLSLRQRSIINGNITYFQPMGYRVPQLTQKMSHTICAPVVILFRSGRPIVIFILEL